MISFLAAGKTVKIVFNGKDKEITISYTYNSNGEEIEVREEKSGNMACSPYLKLAGGDSLDADGKIKSCHFIKFQNVSGITRYALDYNYCYI